jgi:hypothetical protein
VLLRLALCYLLIGCHGKGAIVAGSVTAGVGILATAGNDGESSTDTATGGTVLILTGIGIAIYGLATLNKGKRENAIVMAPPPPQPYPYPGQAPPVQQPPPTQQPPPGQFTPPPAPEPPLPAESLDIADPRLKQIAIGASRAARRNDCDSAKANANQLPPDLIAQLRRIDGALVVCLDKP